MLYSKPATSACGSRDMRWITEFVWIGVFCGTASAQGQQAALACSVPAASIGPYLGKWVLDPQLSDFGIAPHPLRLTYQVAVADGKLTVHVSEESDRGDEFTSDLVLFLDCQKHEGSAGTLRANPSALTFDSEPGPKPFQIKVRTATLVTGGGNILVERRFIRTPVGDTDQTLIFRKVP
jgi:hypothetical protein